MLKRVDLRIVTGGGLLLLGVLMLLEKLKILRGVSGIFWGVVFLACAAYFLMIFQQGQGAKWWAIIPAMLLAGMGVNALLPKVLSGLTGGIFLGALGLAFLIVYVTDHSRWWGIIPGGVLLTLAVVSTMTEMNKLNATSTGSLFFLGLGLTFLLVALLPNPFGKMQWAYIPAVVLALMGALLGSQTTAGLADYIWPAGLILTGLLVLFGFFFRKE